MSSTLITDLGIHLPSLKTLSIWTWGLFIPL